VEEDKGPKRRFELWGESVRELGVLILVFVPLDVIVESLKNDSASKANNHPIAITIWGMVGFLLIVLGVEIERRQ
jgi:hypothetical protein